MGIGIIPLIIVVAIIAGDFGQRVVGQRSDYPADDCLDYCADEYPVSQIHHQHHETHYIDTGFRCRLGMRSDPSILVSKRARSEADNTGVSIVVKVGKTSRLTGIFV
jgi:hypothetical protein